MRSRSTHKSGPVQTIRNIYESHVKEHNKKFCSVKVGCRLENYLVFKTNLV